MPSWLTGRPGEVLWKRYTRRFNITRSFSCKDCFSADAIFFTPPQAATLLLVSALLWLTTLLWSVILIIVARFAPWTPAAAYIGVIDVLLGVWPTFGAIVVLYILASDNAYGLSRIHYRVGDDQERAL